MDEPFGALDAHTRTGLQNELLEIWERDRKTVLFVTHSVDEAVFLSDRVVVMTRSPGRIKETVEIDLPRPRRRAELLLDRRYQTLVVEIERMMDTPEQARHERAPDRHSRACRRCSPASACWRSGSWRRACSRSTACRRRSRRCARCRRSSATGNRCSTSADSLRRMAIGFRLGAAVCHSRRTDDGPQPPGRRRSSIRC